MSETTAGARTLPIPPAEEPGGQYIRDGFVAAYLFREDENRLFLLDPAGTMTEIDSMGMQEVILAVGERITRQGALTLLAAERQQAAAIA